VSTARNSWYLSGRPRRGLGARGPARRLAEAVLGPDLTTRTARQASIVRAAARSRLSTSGRRSTAALYALKDAHLGERCIIIGNGPSLNRTNLRLLAGEHTFGLNRLYLLFDDLGFGTEYHVVVNRLVVQQVASELVAVPGRLISTWPNRRDLAARDDAIFLQSVVGPLFSRDPRRGVWEGATVTFVAIQLAYYMGFEEVVLVGVDHRFATRGSAHAVVTTAESDPNHFDPAYFGKGFRWQLPDLVMSEIAYDLAKQAFAADGRRIVDCTVDGALEVFPKDDLANVLAQRRR
jgi:hypothetical protein